MVFVWMMIAVSPRVRDRLSVVMVRVTLHEVSPKAIAIDVAIANARYLIALTRRCFWVSDSFIEYRVFRNKNYRKLNQNYQIFNSEYFYNNLRQLNRQLVTILGLFFITKIRSAMLAIKIFKNQWYVLFFAHKNANCIGERKNKTLYIITCLRFHHAWGSRHIDRMSCTWFA